MRNYLENIMNTENLQHFDRHIKLMLEYRKSEEWAVAERYSLTAKKPMFRDCFESVVDPFNYKAFIEVMEKDRTYILGYLNLMNKTKENKIKTTDCLKLQWITAVYIGFITEEIVNHLLTEGGNRTNRNKVLDLKYKTDILLNGNIRLQLKNISFLEGTYAESRLRDYLEHKKLNFLFYRVSATHLLELVEVEGRAYVPINQLSGFSAQTAQPLTIEDFIVRTKKGKTTNE